MPRVDFYILPENTTREKFACDIAGRIFRDRMKLYVYAGSEEVAGHMDDLMWTFRDVSFLPHALDGSEGDDGEYITIGWGEYERSDRQVMINLTSAVPSFIHRFERIVEFVPAGDTDRQLARNRYRQYRDAGCELHNHDLAANHDPA